MTQNTTQSKKVILITINLGILTQSREGTQRTLQLHIPESMEQDMIGDFLLTLLRDEIKRAKQEFDQNDDRGTNV
jgi:hypothetical protein